MKIEYSDLYKFLVSIGLGLIAVGFLIPWLVLREPFDLHITQESLESLTPLARSMIEQRQDYLATLVNALPWASAIIIVAGVGMSVGGMLQWWRKTQRIADRRRQLELEEIERRLRPATQADIESKMQAEAIEELEEVPQSEVLAITAKASQVEQRVAQILQDCYRHPHRILKNQRLGHVVFDLVLLSRDVPQEFIRNYTIEVKYIRKGFKFGWLRDNLFKTLYMSDIFEKETGLASFPVLMVIGEQDVLSRIGTSEYVDRIEHEFETLGASASVVVMSDRDLEGMRCERLIALMNSSSIGAR